MRTTEPTLTTELPNKHEYTTSKARGILGKAALRATAIVGSTMMILGLTTATEIVTGSGARAEAASPLDSANGAEKAWCRWPSRWSLCSRVQTLADESFKLATVVAIEHNSSLHNGGADAFRHCLWSGKMTQEFGSETAQTFGDLHEYKEGQPLFERNMDWYNNGKGREFGQQDGDIYSNCLQAMLNNELAIAAPYNR